MARGGEQAAGRLGRGPARAIAGKQLSKIRDKAERQESAGNEQQRRIQKLNTLMYLAAGCALYLIIEYEESISKA